jgi:ATP-dependent Zn protease
MSQRESHVEQLLQEHKAVMEKVAAVLLDKEVLDEKEFAALVGPLPAA